MDDRQVVSELSASSSVAQDNDFTALLKKLDLYKYYPGKLKREDVVGLTSEDLDEKKIEKTEDLGRIFLHRLLTCNYGARDLEIITEGKGKAVTVGQVEKTRSTSSLLSRRKQLGPSSDESCSNAIHPLDVIVSVFLCADPILQQDIAILLWKCKLAIPFITAISEHDIPTAHIWPLRGICARWTVRKNEKIVVEEDTILSPSFFTISFMRFQSSKLKKSIIINTLLSDTEKTHPIFYHRNSKGSTRRRLIADGMVEISWYLTSSSGDILCNEPITVLNLRGNALKYHRQRQILTEMSSICFIVCTSSELDSQEVESIVKVMRGMSKKVFVITYDDEENKGIATLQLEEDVLIFNTESMTDAELKDVIKNHFREMVLKNSFQRTSIEKFSWKDLSVDQEGKEIKDGLLQADTIIKTLICEQTDCRKDKLLPLHQDLWKNWVETDKEIHRLKKIPKLQDITQYRNQLEMDKVNNRREQLKILQQRGVSEAISNFLKALNLENKVTKVACVRWLKTQLDLLSRRELRILFEKETVIKEQMNAFNDKSGETQENFLKELENLPEKKHKSHIGLEHFFRELGQIYEAIQTQTPGDRYNIGYDLPLLAARFLLDGNSLEIFDGDAGSVPLTWVSAVFERLSEMVKEITGRQNPQCSVLTVYGMQSSGKSTLLNTMFGCQFAVGAGRCTRGAQIQMLKVKDSPNEDVHYILLVDTEGVRSPEMPEEIRRPRDNEITTFVIGLGEKTLINLMGENTTYLTEVLPIAVRAFLRMESVGLKPSCAIVYQNVDSQSRDEILSQNRKLKDELDNQTFSACQMEKKEQKHFQDVIQFDVENDIHYIPSLWEGEQPMATVSQGYSKGTLKLKKSLQHFIKQRTGQDLTSYRLHVESLWAAITKDDFVYYFRNTLETEARERLDKFWCKIVWKLRMEASKCGTKLNIDVQNCVDIDKLEEISSTSKVKIRDEIASAFDHQKRKLEDFFDTTEQKYNQYMFQWKASCIDGLTKIKEDLVGNLKLDMLRLQRLKESQFSVERNVQEFKDMIRNDIIQYFKEGRIQIKEIAGKLLHREEIMQLFEEKWKGWLRSVKGKCDVHWEKHNVLREAVDILREKFSSHEALVIQKSDKLFAGKIIEFQLHRSHLIRNTKDVTANTLIAAESIVNDIFHNVRKHLNEITKDPSLYKKGSLEKILQMVSTKENELETLGVKTTTEFEIEISIAVVSIAVSAFSMSETKFLYSVDPIYLLQMEKETFYILFEKKYEKTSFTLSFAKRVSELLLTAVIDRVETDIVREVADDMRSRVYMQVLNNKKSFIYTILCRMASDGVFSRFMDYIRNPARTIDDWLGRYVDEYASASGGSQSKLHILVDRLVMCYKKDLTAYAEETEKHLDEGTDNKKEMEKTNDVQVNTWLKEFTQKALEKFDMTKVRGLSDIFGEEMVDCQHFSTELIKQIDLSKSANLDDLTSKGNAIYETMRINVVNSLRDLVIGCTGHCPFCGEICISSQPNHGGLHETPVHRPQGCMGYINIDTNILVERSCQKNVASERDFRNDRTHGKFVPYKEYQTIHTDWKIPGDPNPLTSSFWEWFMFTYIENLEKEYLALRPVMPNVWETYTKEGEIEKLQTGMKK